MNELCASQSAGFKQINNLRHDEGVWNLFSQFWPNVFELEKKKNGEIPKVLSEH